MSNYIYCGDSHIANVSNSFIEKNGLERSVNEIFKMIDFIINYAIKNKIKYIFHLGDIFDIKKPDPVYYKMLIERLNILEENKIYTYLLKGNHDASNSSASALAPLRKIKYTYIKIIENISDEVIDNKQFIFVPHLTKSEIKDNPDEYLKNKIMELIQNNSVKNSKTIVLGHLQYKGALVGSESIMLRGGINLFPEIDKNKISKVVLGHMHKFQIIKYGKIPIYYPGSMTRNNFGERNEEKGFLTDINDEVEFIDLPATKLKQINIDLVKKNTIDLTEEKIKKIVKNKIVKIVFDIAEKNKNKINISEVCEIFSKYCYVSDVERNIIKSNKKIIKIKSYIPQDIFKTYVDKNINKEIKEEVLSTGLKILDKLI